MKHGSALSQVLDSIRVAPALIGMLVILVVSCPLAAVEYQWPPRDGAPVVTLLGPVYEADLETGHPLFLILKDVLAQIAHDPEAHLPNLYLKRIQQVRHLLFQGGYSNDEEWGYIKTARQTGRYDPVRAAIVLETSKFRQPGLELAVRMQPSTDPNPPSVTLEGYRLILHPSVKGQVEWFTQEVELTDGKAGAAFRKALGWLLVKPFFAGREVGFKEKAPVWLDRLSLGKISFQAGSAALTIQKAPLAWETVKLCQLVGVCDPTWTVEQKEDSATVNNAEAASKLCELFGFGQALSESTWLALHTGKETPLPEVLPVWTRKLAHPQGDELFWWTRHNTAAVCYEQDYGYWRRKLEGHGVVWCQTVQPVETVATFQRLRNNTVIGEDRNIVYTLIPNFDEESIDDEYPLFLR